MKKVLFEALKLMQKDANELPSKVMVSGLQSHIKKDSEDLKKFIEFLYEVVHLKGRVSFADAKESHSELVKILEDLRIPLKSSQIHYLIAGIDSVTAALDLSKRNSKLKFNELLKVISFFSIQAAALSINDNEVARNDLFNGMVFFPSTGEFSDRYTEAQKVMYPLSLILICDRLIDNKIQKCSELVDFLKCKNAVLELKSAIEEVTHDNLVIKTKFDDLTKKINNLKGREESLRNSTFINLLQSDIISKVLFDDKYKQELRSLTEKSQQGFADQPKKDVFISPLSSLLYRTEGLSYIRFKLMEIFGSTAALDDNLIKKVVFKCYQINRREKSIQERIGVEGINQSFCAVGAA
jgi:hypothetical protein